MTDREAIQSAIERVQSGEISVEQATEILLADDRAESLESLVSRLGMPPNDIIDRWCERLRQIAGAYEAQSGEPLPEIALDQWAITLHGDLLFRGTHYGGNQSVTAASEKSLERIERFRQRFDLVHDQAAVAQHESTVVAIPNRDQSLSLDSTKDQSKEPRSKSHRSFPRRASRLLGAAGIALCTVAGAIVLFNTTRPKRTELVQRSEDQALPRDSRRDPVTATPAASSIGRPSTESIDAVEAEDVVILETFDQNSKQDSESAEIDRSADDLSISLDGILPPLDDPSTDLISDSSTEPESMIATDSSSAADSLVDKSNLELAKGVGRTLDDDHPEPQETPQPTRKSTVMAIQLPEFGDVEPTVILADHPLSGLKIDFPFDVPLQVDDQGPVWTIRDLRKQIPVATIRANQSDTTLSWDEQAKQSANRPLLTHGRITAAGGTTIYLRPTIESEPWRFSFDRSDVMPTWDLVHPLAPQVTRLEVEFELPDHLEFGWVEPIDPADFRRARALAVIAPSGDEEISLGVRFEIRSTRKLSCRIRLAARIDPNMDWQLVSTDSLNQFANQLATHAKLVSDEGARLASVYRSLRKPDARQYIRAKQDRNKQLAQEVDTASQRVAKMQTMMAQLESDGAIGFRLWVEWRESKQMILTAVGADDRAAK